MCYPANKRHFAANCKAQSTKGRSEFPLSLFEWSFTIWLTQYTVLSASFFLLCKLRPGANAEISFSPAAS